MAVHRFSSCRSSEKCLLPPMLFLIIIFPLSFTILTLTNVITTTAIVILRVFQQLAKKQVSPSLFFSLLEKTPEVCSQLKRIEEVPW